MFDLIRLFDSNADPDAVYTGLDENLLALVASNSEGVQEQFRRRLGLYFGHIMAFGGLGSEVRDREGGCQ